MGHQAEGLVLNQGLPGLPGCGLVGQQTHRLIRTAQHCECDSRGAGTAEGQGVMGNEDLGGACCQREPLGWALKEEEEFKG